MAFGANKENLFGGVLEYNIGRGEKGRSVVGFRRREERSDGDVVGWKRRKEETGISGVRFGGGEEREDLEG